MKEDKENELRGLQLEFCGRLLAGFTHDLKNHLAIIKESNGLISDMIAMGMISDEMLVSKLQRVVNSIQGRVGQATDMATHLNGFAHRLDTPVSMFQINDLLTEELTFLRRFARLREIELAINLGDGLPVIHNNPSLVQYVVFKLFTMSLKKLKNRSAIAVTTGAAHGGISITIQLSGEKESFARLLDDETTAALADALAKLAGKVEERDTGTDKPVLSFSIPSLGG